MVERLLAEHGKDGTEIAQQALATGMNWLESLRAVLTQDRFSPTAALVVSSLADLSGIVSVPWSRMSEPRIAILLGFSVNNCQPIHVFLTDGRRYTGVVFHTFGRLWPMTDELETEFVRLVHGQPGGMEIVKPWLRYQAVHLSASACAPSA